MRNIGRNFMMILDQLDECVNSLVAGIFSFVLITPRYILIAAMFTVKKVQFDVAIGDYSTAELVLKADFNMAYNNRGVAPELIGEYTRAFQDFETAVRLDLPGVYGLY